ncbi:MAG: RNA polymerase sigma factor [Saprospiraceae bacterium]|nr:RNA polymerase sigma factor [Saprospiraceae bacterium]
MNIHSDQELINGCIRNSRKFQEELYLRFFDKMFGMCLRHTDDEETAMSIMNDGFLNVFKNISGFRGEGSLESWIKKIVFNRIADHYRVKKNNIKYVQLTDERPYDDTFDTYDYELIIKIIKNLPEKDRDIFIMHTIEGYSHVEISEMMKISPGTSKWYLSNAKKTLREMLLKNKINYNKA